MSKRRIRRQKKPNIKLMVKGCLKLLKNFQTLLIGVPTVILLIWTLQQNVDIFKSQSRPLLVPNVRQQEIEKGMLVKEHGGSANPENNYPYAYIPLKNIGKGALFNMVISSESGDEELHPTEEGDRKGNTYLEPGGETGVSIVYPSTISVDTIRNRFFSTETWIWIRYYDEYKKEYLLEIHLSPNPITDSLSVYFEYL